jgi:hypothetical protein
MKESLYAPKVFLKYRDTCQQHYNERSAFLYGLLRLSKARQTIPEDSNLKFQAITQSIKDCAACQEIKRDIASGGLRPRIR